MKKSLVSVFFLFLFILSSLYAQIAKEPKVITINSVRIMEVFKKENKAQYGTKPDKSDEKADTNSSEDKTDQGNGGSAASPQASSRAEVPTADAAAKQADAGKQSAADISAGRIDAESPEERTNDTENTSDTQTQVTTEEAQKAVEEKKDNIIVFTGGVSLSVKEGSSVSTIEADKLVYNRSENTIEAEGNVRYSRKTGGSDGAEEFIGELLLFNIDEMEGIFLDGTIKQAPRKQGQNPFTIQSATVGRDSSGATGFKDAVLSTNPDPDEEPLWSIRASRIWMLPGNELAFANGYFSIGIVPILYLPFFYHPADEMLFHPVFGFRNREGYFVQTTTYLLGRKPLDTDSKKSGSFSNFMKSDRLKKQERIGLFFKNMEEDATDISPAYIKLIADTYSQLGGLIGIDGKTVPKNTPIRQLDFSLFFGMSRTLFPLNRVGSGGISHSTYDTHGKRHYNKSFFMGMQVPFRYRAHINFGISQAPFQLSINMPFISDPYFKKDFFDRSEDMNWFNYLLNKENLAKGADIGRETSFSWKINSSIRPSFKKISPWISSFNLDTASLTVDFSSKTKQSVTPEELHAPQKDFFYPSLFKPEGKISISGTLLSNTMFNEAPVKKNPDVEGIAHPFITQDKTASETSETENANSAQAENQKKDKMEFLDTFIPVFKPVYGKEFDHSITYSLSYSGDFSALQETTFASSQWHNPEDIKWKDYESRYYQLKGSAGLRGTLSYSQNLISLSSNLIISGNYQRHPWTRDVSKKPILELNNFKSNVYTLKNENSVTVNPFVYTDLFKPISFSWSITEILAKNTFTGTYSNPKWETQRVKWNKDFITAHTGSAVFGVILAEKYTQKLTFSVNLPPLLQAYSTSLNVSFPYGTLAASTKLFEKEKTKKKWFWDPFKMELNWALPYDIKMAQTYIYNIEDKKNERLHITFGWKYISAFYTQSREVPQKLVPGSGWVLNGTEKRFIPFALGFSFSNTSNPFTIYAWKNRIKIQLGLSSTLQFNLVRITDSYFTFAPKIIFNIHEFWDFSFGSSSRNDVIARYFQKALNLPVVIPGNTNVLTDLAQSFYFWDRSKREASGFKLQSLDIGFTHYLKDWTLKLNCEIKPQVKNTGSRKYYEFSPTITFAVAWNPISDIKVEAKKKEGKFSVERGAIQ
ncbi:LPS-assembly protein LptD [Treponema medium]|uniref:LPS-assembly protein LptD n=2 Tax=Treponema medium TaxID=58231 RepID=A0AA87TEH3_TREMD|nr:LPS-assembly protein LptD [Treponema medium]EPF28227.1 hypothetical protein HMPREF9195_01919 [Treponema medium ATCC 700293]QSH98022.1 LPS-assembly protein LptD [Treponema medium]